jgi:uncharacterized protein
VTFLLDVNALIAWHHPAAQDHAVFHAWRRANAEHELMSCAITELGFLRVSMQAFHYSPSQAQAALRLMKQHLRFAAELPSPELASWTKTAGQTTDAYMIQITSHHRARLATFDTQIPGATLIAP